MKRHFAVVEIPIGSCGNRTEYSLQAAGSENFVLYSLYPQSILHLLAEEHCRASKMQLLHQQRQQGRLLITSSYTSEALYSLPLSSLSLSAKGVMHNFQIRNVTVLGA